MLKVLTADEMNERRHNKGEKICGYLNYKMKDYEKAPHFSYDDKWGIQVKFQNGNEKSLITLFYSLIESPMLADEMMDALDTLLSFACMDYVMVSNLLQGESPVGPY